MSKRGYNWKARQVVDTIIDDNQTKKIKLDFDTQGSYDQSNQLVLPAQKRKTKIKTKAEKVKILSNKQRKRLEKVVEKKQKKLDRADLLEKLAKVQATPEELQQLTSIASVQTTGLKKFFSQKIVKKVNVNVAPVKISSIKGAKRTLLIPKKVVNNDPNVVGFDSSSDSDSDEDSSDDNDVETITNDDKTQVDKESDDLAIIVSDVQVDNTRQRVEPRNNNLKPETSKAGKSEKKVKEIVEKVERTLAVFVEVNRNDDIQRARLKLPILAEEQQIMETINENSVIIIAGETGSGKTTQIPQFLYEAGYALDKMIGVTEPRRVAAIAMSKRIAEEMNLSTDIVSYLIRFQGNVTENTKIKFMTDGVLFKELKTDFLLKKYSVIILDEAHERSVHTDILIGMLSRIVPLRQKKGIPLKLIIMSATLRLADFTDNKKLFKVTPPVINVEGRLFPVTIHFNKRTAGDYLKETFRKVVKIHTTLPDGGILVFVTGQREVEYLARKLRKLFPLKQKRKILKVDRTNLNEEKTQSENEDEYLEEKLRNATRNRKKKVKIVPEVNLDDYDVMSGEDNDSDIDEDELSDNDVDLTVPVNSQPLWVLPLYSLLPAHRQAQVFKEQPLGCRLCVISTNIAETSLTIPNVKYVVDTGKTKVKLYDKITGVTSFTVHWTSKASADQRAGRAGRTGPGHCYRLYSSAVYNDEFQLFSLPEIQQKPIDDIYLHLKSMNIFKVENFPFPTAPDAAQLKAAENNLEILGMLEKSKVTQLGRMVVNYPILPRFGKMIALSYQAGLIPSMICIVAALSVQEVLLETPVGQTDKSVVEKWRIIRRKWAGSGNSLLLGDPMVLLTAVTSAEHANFDGKLERFCRETGLRLKSVLEIRKIRLQLTEEVNKILPEARIAVDPRMKLPCDADMRLLRQLLLAGLGDRVAKKVGLDEAKTAEDRAKFKYAYRANDMEEPVFLHRGSVLKGSLPEYVVYQEIYETNKMYMRGITAVDREWLPVYVPALCNMSAPLSEREPWVDEATGKLKCLVSGTFGRQAWPLGEVAVDYPNDLDSFKWFAKLFLEGKVFGGLEKYKDSLLQPGYSVIRPWGKLQSRIVKLLQRLTSKNCRGKDDLRDIWEEDKKYLLEEYLMWVPESAHSMLWQTWPPLDE